MVGQLESVSCFNSRPREEGDVRFPFTMVAKSVSTHAPAKRATGGQGPGWQFRHVSTHAPAKRATRAERGQAGRGGFNSRPREEGDSI